MNTKQYPEPIVGAFIINPENKLFLMKSPKWSNLYVVPGGHIELGESIDAALRRESKEETGLDVDHPEFLCLWEFINGEEFHTKKHMIFLNYRVETTSKKIQLNDEGTEYIWVAKKEVFSLPLNYHTKLTLEQFGEKVFTT